ncbi:UNVERIFIED_CONTAM: hypothetical protein GTU68_058187 [Idotea baltica]|nr:hypothetical protein [Idotea baltica]
MQYKRILLKLSGEALMGDQNYGIDQTRLKQYALEIKKVVETGVEVAIVIGGGNIFRGLSTEGSKMDRVQADYMGMLATVINGLALQSALEDAEVQTRLLTAIKMEQIAEPYIKRRAVRHLEKGKASPAMLRSVTVDYYGSKTPLSQVANVNTPDARTISVQPWEKNMLQEIERGIMLANIGFNPMNNGDTIIINVPPLTEERRKTLAKQAKSEAENDKISVRNARRDANNEIKKLEISEDLKKNGEENIQELTNKYIKTIDDLCDIKEKEIMTI